MNKNKIMNKINKMTVKRILMSVVGVIIGAVSVGFFKLAAFGVDPFQSFMSGIDRLIPIGFGTLYVIVNGCLLLFALIFDRHYIGLATFVNLFILGYIVQFSYDTLLMLFPSAGIVIRVCSFIIGFFGLTVGSAIYMTADFGVSTYDAVALTMANKWKIGKFKYLRIATDTACVVLGIVLFLLGGGSASEILTFAGAGTIATAFFTGPFVDFFSRKLARPFLYGKNK